MIKGDNLDLVEQCSVCGQFIILKPEKEIHVCTCGEGPIYTHAYSINAGDIVNHPNFARLKSLLDEKEILHGLGCSGKKYIILSDENLLDLLKTNGLEFYFSVERKQVLE